MSAIDDCCKRLYLQYAASLIRYARCYVDNLSAEDVVHEAFLKFYGKKLLEYSEVELLKLLYVTVRNLCIDQLRHEACINDYKTRTTAEITLRELEDNPESNDPGNEALLNRISELVDTLPDKRRKIFHLYYYKGIDSKNIAEMLDLSQRTVENNVYRALLFIRKNISMAYDE